MAINVLIIFCSSTETTEQLALAAAVGAVQGRANIRIRRLSSTVEKNDRDELVGRLQQEYVAPASADAVWADAVIVGIDDRIAGRRMDPAAATHYGRYVADEVRRFKAT